jgi:hypothetical protein
MRHVTAHVVAILVAGLGIAPSALGGVNVIGQLPQQTSFFGYRGITFDSGSNPLVLSEWDWQLLRIDKATASVLSSQTSNPVASFNDQFVYDPATTSYFTIAGGNSLVRFDPVTLDHMTVGLLGAPQMNFKGLGVDTSGDLWLGMDVGSAQWWRVNKTTGQATFATNITFPGGVQFHTLTIDSSGTFYMAAASLLGVDDGEDIYRLDPITGQASLLTSTHPSLLGAEKVQSMTQDPSTGRFYAVWGPGTGDSYFLSEVTGIPEPTVALVAGVGFLALRRRRARCAL